MQVTYKLKFVERPNEKTLSPELHFTIFRQTLAWLPSQFKLVQNNLNQQAKLSANIGS